MKKEIFKFIVNLLEIAAGLILCAIFLVILIAKIVELVLEGTL